MKQAPLPHPSLVTSHPRPPGTTSESCTRPVRALFSISTRQSTGSSSPPTKGMHMLSKRYFRSQSTAQPQPPHHRHHRCRPRRRLLGGVLQLRRAGRLGLQGPGHARQQARCSRSRLCIWLCVLRRRLRDAPRNGGGQGSYMCKHVFPNACSCGSPGIGDLAIAVVESKG